jgi:oxygen-independent coproporphyrinogen-3 oxidase
VEEGTPFFARRHTLLLPCEDAEAEMAELAAVRLARAGYEHYEISNYARMGRRSRHNMRYWLGADYLGFGPGAHSFLRGVRFDTPADTAAYVQRVSKGDFEGLYRNRSVIAGKERMDEYVMLRMRLLDGIEQADFNRRFGCSFLDCYGPLDKLVAGGFLHLDGERVAFSERGMRVSNAILSDWLDFGGGRE